MTDFSQTAHDPGDPAFLDELLREVIPEAKIALGDLIDRENARPLPPRYAKLMPDTLLVVTFREDAARALEPLARDLERDLTDSCTRHGSLYDRSYRVVLRRSEAPDAPIYQVSGHAGRDLGGPHAELPAVEADRGKPAASPAPAAPLPVADEDATRIDAVAGPPGWQPGRWLLVVEDEGGEEREAFRLTDPFTTVGRRSDDPQLRTTVALSDVPHVSRRQLALLWEERDGAPGFRVYNLGLNPVHLPSQDIPGAHLGRGALRLEDVPEPSTGWLPPGVPLRIGDRGPVLRVDEVPEEEDEDAPEPAEPAHDPDATRFE